MRRSLKGLLCAATLLALLGGTAGAADGSRTVRFHGEAVAAPASWPVIRLARHPRLCVRLDRRVVYLGRPSAGQRCPANAIGRRRAILVVPGRGGPSADRGGTASGGGGPSADRGGTASGAGGPASASAGRVPLRRLEGSNEFTGLGFDACTAPSRRAMAAWRSSPFRAVGVYIGGLNRACSQPNLTASWVSEQVDRGWHLIPTYVGLQSPTSDCASCAKLSRSSASSQGAAAANDAVGRARLLGIGPGSPIYFDMESYARTSSATSATLAFLAAWTARLHGLGYTSGVYSSSASGIADLGDRVGSGYLLPDDLWIANWNGRKSTSDPNVPASAWRDHQRIHQYSGGHNETYRGVTINIDGDYVEGATVGDTLPGDEDPRGRIEFVRSPGPGHVRISGWAFDPSSPATPIAIRAFVGGRRGAARYDLGAIATLPRPDVGARHRAAGELHGFDDRFATIKSGRQRVCVYAVDVGPGSDTLLGCRGVGIGVAVTVSKLSVHRNGLRLRLRCEWPEGTECPGQVLLRARVRQRLRGGRRVRRRARVRMVRVARRPFKLTGGRSGAFAVPLTRRGRLLSASAGRLRGQLVVAIPGGRRYKPLLLR